MDILFVITRGEQYAVEIVIKNDEDVITPNNCDDVKIKLGNLEKKYSDNEIFYEDGRWLFPLTQEQTLAMNLKRVNLQAQYKSGSNIFSTDIYAVQIKDTVINGTW